jgi:hypothetical protein
MTCTACVVEKHAAFYPCTRAGEKGVDAKEIERKRECLAIEIVP